MLGYLLCVLCLASPDKLVLPDQVTLIREYQAPSEPALAPVLPGAVDFGPDGRMYLLDQREARVLMYGKDGSFIKAFSAPNPDPENAPNPMMSSIQLGIGDGEVWVWTRKQRMFVFDLEGNPLRHASIEGPFPKSMGVLKKDLLLLSSGVFIETTKNQMKVLLADLSKGMIEVMSFENTMFLDRQMKPVEKMTVRAFGPDLDIQRDEKGIWYFGFGEDNVLFTVDHDGNVTGQFDLQLKRTAVTAEEKEYVEKVDFPVWSGQRVALSDDETMLDYRDPKANFTQFTIKGGKGIFVLTATGGYMTDLYAPSARASYQIVDLGSGDVTGSGAYAFPAESNILYRNGRIIAAIFEKDHYRIAEIAIKGFNDHVDQAVDAQPAAEAVPAPVAPSMPAAVPAPAAAPAPVPAPAPEAAEAAPALPSPPKPKA